MKLSPKIVIRIGAALLLGIAISYSVKSGSNKRQAEADREKKKQQEMEGAIASEKLERTPKPEQKELGTNTILPSALAGEYMVFIDSYNGNAEEIYTLERNGKATWQWFQDGQLQNTNVGSWTTDKSETEIVTKIMGGTEVIVETFILTKGKFRSGDRYLKKVKPLLKHEANPYTEK